MDRVRRCRRDPNYPVRAFIRGKPEWVPFLVSLIMFVPSIIMARLRMWATPKKLRMADLVVENVVLGSLPIFPWDVSRLIKSFNVKAVINMQREWCVYEWSGYYRKVGISSLRLPTTDYITPKLEDIHVGVKFIQDHVARGETVYVHCKAGKGRSMTIVLCYLITLGFTPEKAVEYVRERRPIVADKSKTLPVLAFYKEHLARQSKSKSKTTIGGASKELDS